VPAGLPGRRAIVALLLPLQKLLNLVRCFLLPALEHASFLRRRRFDLVHLNNSVNGNHEWMLAARIARLPLVSHERGVGAPLSGLTLWLAGWVRRHICVSNHVRDRLVANGIPRERTAVVYNGLDTREIRVRREPHEIRVELGIPDAAPVIGVVGNVKKWKGQETVVRASALLSKRYPELRCLLVGLAAPDDPYVAGLTRLAGDLGVDGRVIFTGFQKQPADFTNVMDVVVHSSITPEPFGLVNIEAMYLRKPVVATRLGGPVEIFEDGCDGFLVDAADPAALAEKVGALLADPVLRQLVGDAAHLTVMQRFTVAGTVGGVEKVYDEVCG
jgi:glycosyltransferase involved in cell wall biosynthesis